MHEVGNTVVDAVHLGRDRLRDYKPEAETATEIDAFLRDHAGRRIVLVTAHRRENWGEPMACIASAVRELVDSRDDVAWIWPMHQNPDVRNTIQAAMADLSPAARQRLLLTAPADYPSLLQVLDRCTLTLTDSGGIQEEAATLARPVVVMRESTERQELIDAGGGVLVGADAQRIRDTVRNLLDDAQAYAAMRISHNPFGDGQASSRIADLLEV